MRLTDIDELMKALGVAEDCNDCKRYLGGNGVNSCKGHLRWLCHKLRKAPIVEPIVRCKDCKKHSDENELHEVFCQVYEAVKPEDGYCDWGERKDEAEDGRCD